MITVKEQVVHVLEKKLWIIWFKKRLLSNHCKRRQSQSGNCWMPKVVKWVLPTSCLCTGKNGGIESENNVCSWYGRYYFVEIKSRFGVLKCRIPIIKFSYLGRGDHETYADRNQSGRDVSAFTTQMQSVCSIIMWDRRHRVNRTDVRWVNLDGWGG